MVDGGQDFALFQDLQVLVVGFAGMQGDLVDDGDGSATGGDGDAIDGGSDASDGGGDASDASECGPGDAASDISG